MRLANFPIRSTNARLGAMFHRQIIEEAAEVFGEVGCAGVPAARVERQAFGRQGIEAPRNLGTAVAKRGGLRRQAIMSSSSPSSGVSGGRLGKRGRHRRAIQKRSDPARRCRIAHQPTSARRRPARVERVEMLGRHVGQCAADQGTLDFTFRRADLGFRRPG